MQAFIGVVMVVGFVGLFALVAMFAARQRAASVAAWQAFAQETGIAVSGDYPMMSFHASWQGATVSLMHHVWRGHKGQRHYRHEIAVQIPSDIGDLSVTREGIFDMLGKVFGGQDVQVGDSVFDPAFRIRCSSETLARDVLTAPVRQAFLRAVQQHPTLHVDGGWARLTHPGIARAEDIRRQLEALVPIATSFAHASPYRAPARPPSDNPYAS